AALAKMLEAERRVSAGAGAAAVPADQLERLGALGYASGGATTSTPGADPKDKIREFRRANEVMRNGILALNRREFAAAARGFEALLADGIESFESHLYLARAFAGLNQPDRAAPHFERAARLAPTLEDAWAGWAETRRAAAGPEPALAIVREGRSKNPRGAQLALLDADLSQQLGRPEDAIAALKTALPLRPADPGVRERLGTLQRDLGQVDAALASFRDAVAVDPTSASAWNALGMTLGGNGRLDEAERAFRSAVERDATDHRYVFNLGLALARQGRGRTSSAPCSSNPASRRRATSCGSWPRIGAGNERQRLAAPLRSRGVRPRTAGWRVDPAGWSDPGFAPPDAGP